MSNTLRIELADREGALMRLIGLIERRGFAIARMDKSPAESGQAMITMSVAAREGARRIDVLVRQISRLFEVESVFAPEMIPEPIAQGRASCRPRA